MKLDAVDSRLLDMLQLDCDTPIAEFAAPGAAVDDALLAPHPAHE